MGRIVIRNESDLVRNFKLAQSGDIGDEIEIIFEGWPNYETIIRGDQFHGGVPTRVMPKIMAIQKAMRAAYSLQKYGEVRRLDKNEREKTELVVFFQSGRSTKYSADLTEILNIIAREAIGNMTGPETIVAILGSVFIISAFYAGHSMYKKKLENQQAIGLSQEETKKAIALSQEETKRLQIVQNLANTNETMYETKKIVEESQDTVLKSLNDDDKLIIGDEDNEVAFSGETIKSILRKPRETAIEDRMDGKFIILSVDSGSVKNGYKMKVREIETGVELIVEAPEGTLPEEQVEILQNGEWGKEPVHMQINHKKLRERIYDAKLIEAGLSKTE